jgi:hypothetical protein
MYQIGEGGVAMESTHAEFMLEVLMRIATALEKQNADTRNLAETVEGVANRLEELSSYVSCFGAGQ